MKKSELKEIKKSQEGTGLLIENDGYISMAEGKNKTIREFNENSEGWKCPYPFIVDAVFQKFGIKNANGRIYPEKILKREVEKYQQRINERRAIGECYTPDVLVLTETGWKTMAEVKEGENVLTLNVDTKKIEIHPVIRKIEYEYDGDMIEIRNRNILDLVTPNHKFPLFSSYNDNYVGSFTAEDMMNDNVPNMAKKYIYKRGIWEGLNDEYFTIPNLTQEQLDKMHERDRVKYDSDLVIPMHIFAKFMGIYLSEGHCSKREGGTVIQIYQKKESVCEEIEQMLNEWSIKYNIELKENGCKIYVICDMRLCAYLQQFGICYDKFVPFELKQQNSETLKIFYDWFVKGDGRIRGDQKRRKKEHMTDDVFSTSERLILDLNEIQTKIGFSGHFHMEKRDNDRYIFDRLIEGKNCHPMYFSLRSRSKSINLDKRFVKFTKVPYKGTVMCIEVENHNFYVMSHGRSHWTSNCNHPDDSTIDLGRISHNIIELHWEGKTLVGKLELNVSKGFVDQGICSTLGDTVANLLLNGYRIGVSSRGVGSVEQRLGQYLVGEDFELICWDIVADPSTPMAYIESSHDKLQPYIESANKSGNMLSEKVNKIKNILNN
ncbi:MAG: hypothetical protein IKT40_00355 [Bacilli bacterium]|nr:hypothetical protein [Bacilli bacterium]